MPKLRSVYAGGFSDAKKRKLQSYKLPPKVKCSVCLKVKAVNFFSTIQQLELQNGMATGQIKNATVEGWVPCVSCTPKQVTELECCMCQEVKALDGFAKAQRRLKEEAKCMVCMAELNGELPVEGTYRQHLIDQLRDSEDDDDDDESVSNVYESSTFSETESDVGVPLSSDSGYDLNKENLNSLSLSTNSQASKPSTSNVATSASVMATKRTRVPAAASKWQEFTKDKGKSVEPVGGAQFTGFDRDGKGHQMVRPASTASDDSDNETIADPHERARLAKAERDARSRFAKLPGGKGVPVAIPTYVGGKTVPNYQADYDDDDGDYDGWGTI